MKLTGRWFPQIVDRDSSNLYPIYIYKNCGVSFWTCSREISGDRVALFVLNLGGGGVMFFLHFMLFQTFLDEQNSGNKKKIYNCIPRTKYVRGILWFSRRYAAASASAFHRLRDNLNNPYRIASIFDRWEDSWEARWARSDYLWATQGPPNSQKCTYLYIVAHIWKTGSYFFPLLYICLLCDEVLLSWNFRSPGFDVRGPPGPPPPYPNMTKKYICFHILGFKLKKFLSDCFLSWHVHRCGW